MAQQVPEAEQLINDYADLWNNQDYEHIADVVSESFVHSSPAIADGEAHGPEGVEAFMREVTTGFPDFEVTPLDILSKGDLVMVENKFTMTHEGEFNGIPPTGREIVLRSMVKSRAEDGKLQELHEYLDMHGVLQQLGVMDEQPPG